MSNSPGSPWHISLGWNYPFFDTSKKVAPTEVHILSKELTQSANHPWISGRHWPFAPGFHGFKGFRVWKSIRHSRNQASPKEGAWEIVGHWKISSYLNHPAGKRPHFEVGEPSPGREMEDYRNCISLRRMNSKFLRFPGEKTRHDVWLESATRTKALNCTCFGRWLKACNS